MEDATQDLPTNKPSTPRISKQSQAQSHQYEELPLMAQRQMLGDENRCLNDVPLDILWTLVPSVSAGQLQKMDKQLQKHPTLLGGAGWHELQTLGKSEASAYNNPFERIANAIIAVAKGRPVPKGDSKKNRRKEGPAKEITHEEKQIMLVQRETMIQGETMTDTDVLHERPEADESAYPTLEMKCDGNITYVSEASVSSKPIGSLAFQQDRRRSVAAHVKDNDTTHTHIEDVMLCTQFKLHRTPAKLHDNLLKMLYDGCQMMRDPCRRFAFGLTIEAYNVRIYFFSRAFMFRTEVFDINKDYMHLIKFFASLAIASDEELGWDPTIFHTTADDGIQYCIKVGQHWYRTFGKPLADFRANDITGRGTRAWKVYLVTGVDNKKLVLDMNTELALKDLWISEKQEAIKIKLVRHALERRSMQYPDAPDASDVQDTPGHEHPVNPEWFHAPEDDKNAFADDASPQFSLSPWGSHPWDKYFPYVKEHGYVKLDIKDKNQVDSIHNMMGATAFGQLRDGKFTTCSVKPPESAASTPKTSFNSNSNRSRSSGNHPLPVVGDDAFRPLGVARLRNSVHYREVFQHVGQRLDEVPLVVDVCRGLRDIAIVLRWLTRIGWVHRDLSVGNVLVVEIDRVLVAQLTDFEYSQPIHGQGLDKQYKTGTPDFMAAEVENGGKWAFLMSNVIAQRELLEESRRHVEATRARRAVHTTSTPENFRPSNNIQNLVQDHNSPQPRHRNVPLFMATPLHDAEGLFWMFKWTFDVRSFQPDDSARAWQLESYNTTFVSKQKLMFLKTKEDMYEWIAMMAVSGSPLEKIGLTTYLCGNLIETLTSGYKTLESTSWGELNHSAYSDNSAPRLVVEHFTDLADVMETLGPIHLYGRIHFKASGVDEKRARGTTNALDKRDAKKMK